MVLAEKRKKAMMNQFQLSVNESAERIEELIYDVDDNNLNLKNDIVQIEEDLEKLELEKKKANPRSHR